MELKFVVHRANDTKISKEVALSDGSNVQADVQAFEVELVSSVENCGSWVGRFVGKNAEEAKKLFVNGASITFSAV